MSFEAQGDGSIDPGYKPQTRILIVLPVLPWPLRESGASVRFAPIIEYLSHRYLVDILVLESQQRNSQALCPILRSGSVEILSVPTLAIPPLWRKIKTVWRALVPNGEPFGSVRHLNYADLELKIATRVHNGSYGAVVWAAGHLGMACRLRAAFPSIRFVIDIVDSPALLCSREVTSHLLKRTLRPYTAWKWRRLERRVQHSFDATIYISPVDASTAHPSSASKIFVIPNGVTKAESPRDPACVTDRRGVIGFLGDMSYLPNISAALRLAKDIFPLVRAALPGATLLIIGRNPVPSIRALESANITVTGTVEDIGVYLAKLAVCLFPMIEGAGLQNKILDAMHAKVAVVTTPLAAASLGAASGNQLLIGETDQELAQHTVALLRDPDAAAEIACRAHAFAMQRFSWNSLLPRYERLVLPDAPHSAP